MAKLWQKNYELNELIESFTVGRDYILDVDLIPADIAASLAHGTMLNRVGLLSDQELEALRKGFLELLQAHSQGQFVPTRSDEDGHTALENRLVLLAGDAGKKIHTGRSRNDQVITALRVFGRSAVHKVAKGGFSLIKALLEFSEAHKETPMPGRTHMQIAMPSSVGLWSAAFAEELLDQMELLRGAYALVDQSSLGSAASYGVPLPIDRGLTSKLLGFAKVQNNVLYVNNSRGKMEAAILDVLDSIGLTLSKMAQDLILFSLPEMGYFQLPSALCSGSSIMPQKKNPDGLELMRAKSATLGSYSFQVKSILRSLPSGYNRDFQETKEPFLRGLSLARDCLAVMELTFRELEVNGENLKKGFSKDIYATDAALELVQGGATFRDAYREVGLNLDTLADRDPLTSLRSRTHQGSTGNLGLELSFAEMEEQEKLWTVSHTRINKALTELLGAEGLKLSKLS